MVFQNEIGHLLNFLILSLILSFVLFLLTWFISNKSFDKEKLSSYECGFEPFNDTKNGLNIHFYRVAVVFLIFDLEIILSYPWAINPRSLGVLGF